jgi:Spy/CpxP family protein refolding chaperone
MRRKTLLPVVAFLALLCVPGLAAAARGPGEILANPRLLARYLRLTPEQVAQQRVLLRELHAELEPLREQRQELRDDLREALEASSPDACSVGALVVDLDALRDQTRAALEAFDEAFSAILTEDQRARYEALKEAARLLRESRD